jgi:hypothetical protein
MVPAAFDYAHCGELPQKPEKSNSTSSDCFAIQMIVQAPKRHTA